MNHSAPTYFVGLPEMSWKITWEVAVAFQLCKNDHSTNSIKQHSIVDLSSCTIESKPEKGEKVLTRQGKNKPVTHQIYTMCAYGIELEIHVQS